MQIRQKRAATKKNSFSEQSSITTNKEKGYSSSKNDVNELSRKVSSSDDSPAEFETTRATKHKLRNADSNYQGKYKKMITGKYLEKNIPKPEKKHHFERKKIFRHFKTETIKIFEEFLSKLMGLEEKQSHLCKKKNGKNGMDNIAIKLLSEDTLNPNILNKVSEPKQNSNENFKIFHNNAQYQHILLENRKISQNNEYPIYVRNPVYCNFGISVFPECADRNIYPSKPLYDQSNFYDPTLMNQMYYSNERARAEHMNNTGKMNTIDRQPQVRKYFTTEQTQQVPTNFIKDIINRHTPNHITVARFIKASQEAEKNADNRSTAACTIKDGSEGKQSSAGFPDVSKFKASSGMSSTKSLINNCNVEDVTKSQLEQISQIVAKGFEKEPLKKSSN